MVLTTAILMLIAFAAGAGCTAAGVLLGRPSEKKPASEMMHQKVQDDEPSLPEPETPPLTEAQQQYSRAFAEWLGGQAG